MSEEDPLREEKKIAVARWADQYTERFDVALTNGWPDLAERLRSAAAALPWYAVAVGPGAQFRTKSIEPLVQAWVERHVQPVVDEATEAFERAFQRDPGQIGGAPAAAGKAPGALHVQDVLEGLALPAGVLVAGGAVAAAVAEVTVWLVFTTIVVNWPLLIAGLAVGAALSFFGVYRLTHLKATLDSRFAKSLLPGIENAVVGDGFQHEGKTIPSLKDQLKGWVREAAETAYKALDAGV